MRIFFRMMLDQTPGGASSSRVRDGTRNLEETCQNPPLLTLPSEILLAEVERAFSVAYPETFHSFCRRGAEPAKYPGLRRGTFVTDLPTLEAINQQIGAEEWGDYERILAGKEHPKSGRKVLVWSVHCIVHSFPTLDAWLEGYEK